MIGREKSEDARYDTVVRAHIKQQVPDAKKRFPTLDMGWNTDAAEGKDLADIERQLTPEEQDRVSASMQKWANVAPQQPWMKARNPAAKPAAAAAPRPGVGAPAHAAAAAGPQASLDPEMLRTLQSIDRKMDSGGGGYIGSLPIDGGDSGPRRA
jgi:cytochrome c1